MVKHKTKKTNEKNKLIVYKMAKPKIVSDGFVGKNLKENLSYLLRSISILVLLNVRGMIWAVDPSGVRINENSHSSYEFLIPLFLLIMFFVGIAIRICSLMIGDYKNRQKQHEKKRHNKSSVSTSNYGVKASSSNKLIDTFDVQAKAVEYIDKESGKEPFNRSTTPFSYFASAPSDNDVTLKINHYEYTLIVNKEKSICHYFEVESVNGMKWYKEIYGSPGVCRSKYFWSRFSYPNYTNYAYVVARTDIFLCYVFNAPQIDVYIQKAMESLKNNY